MNSLIRTGNLTPEEEYRAKLLRVFELALQLNPTETNQRVTGIKPTVFMDFSGNLAIFNLWIYNKGWGRGVSGESRFIIPVNDYEYSGVDGIIEALEYLLSKWG